MKIALIGYGKMGHAIERHALQRGHSVVCRIDTDNIADFNSPEFASADVAIEFSVPTAAPDNVKRALSHNIPVVSGTTGWADRLPEFRAMCEQGKGTMMWSSNFSIGVNLFMKLNKYLTQLMSSFPQYHPSIHEVHHIHKLDHPSGTAITLAGQIMEEDHNVKSWTEVPTTDTSQLVISHERRGEVPGIHTIMWDSPVDAITITHEAKSRDGFALGAVMAAEWLHNKKGYYTIEQFIQDIIK